MTTTCTGCGDHQSGDPGGLCYSCRVSEIPGYLAQLNARVAGGMAREYADHPDWTVRQPRTAPGRFIGDPVVYADCPGCGWAVPAGFEHNDPGAETRQPRPCGPCQEAELAEAGHQADAGTTEVQETRKGELELGA